MTNIRELKWATRRKEVRRLLRQGYSIAEIAERLGTDWDTIHCDVIYIKKENAQFVAANKTLVKKDVENLLTALDQINLLDEEAWKIYYGENAPLVDIKIGTDENGKAIMAKKKMDVNPRTQLDALEKIRQNNLDRAKLLKLLNPSQITVEKMVYIEKMMPVVINKLINITLEYVPDNKKVTFLERIKTLDLDKEIMQ